MRKPKPIESFFGMFTKKVKWVLGSIVATIVTISSIYGAAAAFNFHMDRPAWHSELLHYTGYSLKREQEHKRRELNQLNSHMNDLQGKGVAIPFWLINQKQILEQDLKAIENILRQQKRR